MHPVLFEVCFCLLHPHRSNSLVVVHWTGGGKTHILRTLGVIKRGIDLIFIPLLTLLPMLCTSLSCQIQIGETLASITLTKSFIAIEKIRPWIPAFLTHILRFCQEGGVYKRYFWASASLETCAPGGSYFAYSVFLGVTLAWSMQSPESLVFDLQQLY